MKGNEAVKCVLFVQLKPIGLFMEPLSVIRVERSSGGRYWVERSVLLSCWFNDNLKKRCTFSTASLLPSKSKLCHYRIDEKIM